MNKKKDEIKYNFIADTFILFLNSQCYVKFIKPYNEYWVLSKKMGISHDQVILKAKVKPLPDFLSFWKMSCRLTVAPDWSSGYLKYEKMMKCTPISHPSVFRDQKVIKALEKKLGMKIKTIMLESQTFTNFSEEPILLKKRIY